MRQEGLQLRLAVSPLEQRVRPHRGPTMRRSSGSRPKCQARKARTSPKAMNAIGPRIASSSTATSMSRAKPGAFSARAPCMVSVNAPRGGAPKTHMRPRSKEPLQTPEDDVMHFVDAAPSLRRQQR